MNLVSLLIASAVVSMGVGQDQNDPVRILIALAAAATIAGAVYISKRRSIHIGDDDEDGTPGTPPHEDDHVAAGTPVGNPASHPSTPASAPAQSEPAPTQQFEPPRH